MTSQPERNSSHMNHVRKVFFRSAISTKQRETNQQHTTTHTHTPNKPKETTQTALPHNTHHKHQRTPPHTHTCHINTPTHPLTSTRLVDRQDPSMYAPYRQFFQSVHVHARSPTSSARHLVRVLEFSHPRVLLTSTVFPTLLSLATVSLLSAVSSVDAVTYDETRAIQYAKLAGAAYCESSVPSWSCGYKCVSGVSSVEACQGATTQAYVADCEGRCVVAFEGPPQLLVTCCGPEGLEV